MLRSLTLTLALLAPVGAQATTVFATDSTVARAEPSGRAARVVRIAACTPIEATGRSGNWLAVQTAQGPAFVRAIDVVSHAGHCLGTSSDHDGAGGDWGGCASDAKDA
ncbi:MAG: hypothetical protein KDK12_16025 [Rhodobacteraceae bacterium]|nr:hypothetical protein [Paracoccaceae bacterium]